MEEARGWQEKVALQGYVLTGMVLISLFKECLTFSFSLELIKHKLWRRGLVCKGNANERLTSSLEQASLNHRLQDQQHIFLS